jgi:hypothetical protein
MNGKKKQIMFDKEKIQVFKVNYESFDLDRMIKLRITLFFYKSLN